MATPPAAARGHDHPASLTEWLRGRTDDELAALLRRRPDLALPAPADLAALASRLSVRTSVQRAIDALDAYRLRTLEALVLVAAADGAVHLPDAQALTPVDLGPGVTDLLDLGLVWGAGDRLHLVATVRESVGPYPAGLGRPAATLLPAVPDVAMAGVLSTLGLPPAGQPRAGEAVAAVLADPARVTDLVALGDDTEREILDRLAAGPPVGVVRHAQLATAAQQSPPHRLIARGLLVPIDAQTVELPREVGIALRGTPLGDVGAEPDPVPVVERAPADLDRLGTTAVLDVLRRVETLAESWTAHPPAQLRAGGLGVRELRRTAKDVDVDEATAALLIEVAAAAGLLAPTTGVDPVYLPTTEYDVWRRHDAAGRWADLASAWLAMTRQPSLVNQRGERERLISALSPDAERGTVPALRLQVLETLAQLPPGASPRGRDDVLTRLAWQAPRRASGQRAVAAAILAEADALGVTAAGGLTGYSRTLVAGTRAVAEQVLAGALPEPVDHFLVQPDLTLVVPGPPAPALAEELAAAADLESTGGASVYRITESSVRRALDAGRSGAELTRFVTENSRTPVPQALTYLIDDVARRHGVLRTGAASAYLRCDDEVLLSRVLADRGVDDLQLRRIAPTVVVSTAPVAKVLDRLRAAGYAPAAEAPDGGVITLDAEAPRAVSRPPVRPLRSRAADSTAHLGELVRRIRAGDTLTEISRRVQPIAQQVPGVTSATTMGLLRDAIRNGRRVWLGYVDADGTASQHELEPISLGGGYVRGPEPGRTGLQSYALHRITAVSVIDDDADPAAE